MSAVLLRMADYKKGQGLISCDYKEVYLGGRNGFCGFGFLGFLELKALEKKFLGEFRLVHLLRMA